MRKAAHGEGDAVHGGLLPRLGAGCLLFAAVAGTWACGGGQMDGSVPDERPTDLPSREVRPAAWDTLFHAGGTLEDTLLQRPVGLAADADGVFLLDAHARRVLRFDGAGALAWSWGRRGGGPDELEQPHAIQVDGAGRAWVLDVENGRLVVLTPSGRVERRVALDGAGVHPHGFVPLDDGGAILTVLDRERPLVQLDSEGTVLARTPFPWTDFARLNPLASQLLTARDPFGPSWAAAFAVGDGFFGFEGDRWLGYRGWYVEPVRFPSTRVVRGRAGVGRTVHETSLEGTSFAAMSLALDADRLLVLFAGRTGDAGRLVDIYRLEDGAYLETLRLPVPAARLSYADSVYYVLAENPYPELLALRKR